MGVVVNGVGGDKKSYAYGGYHYGYEYGPKYGYGYGYGDDENGRSHGGYFDEETDDYAAAKPRKTTTSA